MIIDRYPPVRLFTLVPELPQAFEPELAQLDRLLEDDAIFGRTKADMARRRPHRLSLGRPGTPVEVVLRLLVIKRRHGWSDEEVEHLVPDSLVLRQFGRVHREKVPAGTTLLRWAHVIAPETLAVRNDRAVALARQLAVTGGRKLRLDSTVVATTIPAAAACSPMACGCSAGSCVAPGPRSAKRPAWARRCSEPAGAARGVWCGACIAWARLIAVARKTHPQATRVGTALPARPEPLAQRPARQLDPCLPRVARAIGQAGRRVLQGATVPAGEKIVSLLEPHSQSIARPKAGKPVALGRKLRLEEVEGGIVSGWRLLDRPGQDAPCPLPSLAAHRERFGRPPWLVTGDRGMLSPENERQAKAAGVRRVVLPAVGTSAPERSGIETQRWFRRGFRFRAGIEGRSSVLQRCYGLDRCRDHGEGGMGRWIGWGIVAGNLERIARTVAARQQAAVV